MCLLLGSSDLGLMDSLVGVLTGLCKYSHLCTVLKVLQIQQIGPLPVPQCTTGMKVRHSCQAILCAKIRS